ncbi:MAG: helix-turn-helix transcriptional regulator [Pseudomonadota bacterium]
MDIVDRITGMISEKDENSVVTCCNEIFLKYAGVKSFDDILGHTDYDFPWQNFADIYRAHEKDALVGNNYSTFYPVKDCHGTHKLFMHTKVQKLSPDGEILGIKCHAAEILNPQTANLMQALSSYIPEKQTSFFIGKKFKNLTLPPQQQEVLFFLLRGKTSKQIAKIMRLSPRTIEFYITILKEKFNCQTKQALIECAINQGFMEMIPEYKIAKYLFEQLKTQ